MRRQEENGSRKCNDSPMAAQRLCFVILLSWFSSLFIWICSEITDGFVFCNRKWGLCVCCFFLCSPPFWFLRLYFLKKKSHKNNFVWPVQEKIDPKCEPFACRFCQFSTGSLVFLPILCKASYRLHPDRKGVQFPVRPLGPIRFSLHCYIYIYTYVILHVDVDYVKVKLDEAIKKLA